MYHAGGFHRRRNPYNLKISGSALLGRFIVLILLAIIVVIFSNRISALQEQASKAELIGAKAYLDTRESVAWVKYREGKILWDEIQNPDTITGGTEGFGDFKVEDGELKACQKFTMTVDISRVPPTPIAPGRWELGEFHN